MKTCNCNEGTGEKPTVSALGSKLFKGSMGKKYNFLKALMSLGGLLIGSCILILQNAEQYHL